ncbi:MAG: hypothetical protein GX962_03465 [Epulopiscium sp.]|nr:hypothetical protein [Candidatus Epulonipiscium sp.]
MKDPKKNTTEREYEENARRLEQLDNLIQKHTRTERHLEQHSDIASPEKLDQAEELQQVREEQMEQLKSKILAGPVSSNEEYNNLKRNFEQTEGYLENNKDHIDDFTMQKIKEKQEHRNEQMDFLT